MVIPSYFPLVGGAEKQVAGLSKSLNKNKCQITVVSRRLNNTLRCEVIDGINVVRLFNALPKAGFLIGLIHYLYRNRNNIDVIHVHTLNSPAVVSSVIGGLLNIPVIVKVTRSGRGCQLSRYQSSIIGQLFFSLLSRCTTRFIAITNDVKNELLSIGVEKEMIVEIPNGVELPKLSTIDITSKRCKFVFVGRLITRKCVDILIESFSQSKVGSDNRLIIIGEGDQRKELVELVERLNLSASVELRGELNHNEVLTVLAKSDVFVLPSESEGMSNALLEAMASKMTVIVRNIPANNWLIKHNVNGLLFADKDQLCSCMEMVQESTELRNRLSENARREVEASYSFNTVAMQYESLYNQVIFGPF